MNRILYRSERKVDVSRTRIQVGADALKALKITKDDCDVIVTAYEDKVIITKKPKENENHFFEIVNDIKDENEMNAILQNERHYKNKVPEHIQKTIESQRKQKESTLSKRKNETEERLYNEYLSIKSSNSIIIPSSGSNCSSSASFVIQEFLLVYL